MKKLIAPFVVLLFILFAMLVQNSGVKYSVEQRSIELIDEDVFAELKSETVGVQAKSCLILYDSSLTTSVETAQNIAVTLDNLRVKYDMADMTYGYMPPLEEYETVVVSLKELDEFVYEICDWVRDDGGRAMFAMALDWSTVLNTIKSKLGIMNYDMEYGEQNSLHIVSDFMIGAQGKTFGDAILSNAALMLYINDNCTLHVQTDDEKPMPLLWERDYGEGRFVVNNCDIMSFREARGYVAAAYSLLNDAFAYPVINGSAFFIDDWPAPVSQGYDIRLYEQYGTSIHEFYTNVWWPDMQKLTEKYGIKFTGLLIETYNEETEPPYEPVSVVSEYTYSGAMLLKMGGEIGYHGYNHMPLCLENFDYRGKLDYEKYKTIDDMSDSLKELMRFGAEVFPENDFVTYVPPSNVLCAEARYMIGELYDNIKVISGIYSALEYEFEQDFDVSDDGIINVPRAVSGCEISEFMDWVSINLISYQYVNSHFLHPDDVLDDERGADKGWENMYAALEAYVHHLSELSGLRNMTASELAGAVQRYDCLNAEIVSTHDEIDINLCGFYDEAWLMVRIRDGAPQSVEGGELTQVSDEMYLLNATASHVKIYIGE